MSGIDKAGFSGGIWGWHLAQGLLMLLVGMAAIVFPLAASLAVEILIGWLMIVLGCVGVAHAVAVRRAPGFLFRLAASLAAALIGGWMILAPVAGMLALAILLGIYFVVTGLSSIGLSFVLRSGPAWFLIMLSGGTGLILGALVLLNLRGDFTWIIGIMFGVSELINGWAMVFRGLAEKAAVQPPRK